MMRQDFCGRFTDPAANQDAFTRNKLGQIASPKIRITLISYAYDEVRRNIIKNVGSTTVKMSTNRIFGPLRQEEVRNGSNYMTV
ncbi:hypothetical protein D3C77_731010 [compost metagenome]